MKYKLIQDKVKVRGKQKMKSEVLDKIDYNIAIAHGTNNSETGSYFLLKAIAEGIKYLVERSE